MPLRSLYKCRCLKVCQEKTSSGNSYSQQEAKRVAKKVRQSVPTINYFECAICGRWHIGDAMKRRAKQPEYRT